MQDRVSKAAKEHVAEYVAQMEATDAERWARRESKSLRVGCLTVSG